MGFQIETEVLEGLYNLLKPLENKTDRTGPEIG